MKIIANNQEPYSILNPETSSDSPSARSNGTRFNSARMVMIQIIKIGKNLKIRGNVSWNLRNERKLYL